MATNVRKVLSTDSRRRVITTPIPQLITDVMKHLDSFALVGSDHFF